MYKFENTIDSISATNNMDANFFNTSASTPTVTTVTDKDAAKARRKAEAEAKAQMRAELQAFKAAAKLEKKLAKAAVIAAEANAAANAIAKGETLAKEEEAFELLKNANESTHNSKRYSLLTKIHALAEEVLEDAAAEKIINAMRRELLNKYDIKTQANSTAVSVITRFVTRTNRKNACVYARVINVAISKGIRSNGLEQFIIDSKGMQNIRPELTTKEAQKKQSADNKKRMFDSWSRYGMNKLYDKANTGNVLAELNLSQSQHNDIADGRGRAIFVHMFGCYHNGKLSVVDFAPAVTAEDEWEMLSEYAYFELMRLESRMGKEKAFFAFNEKIKHLFDMYNSLWSSIGSDYEVNRFGEVIGDGRQITEYRTPFNELEQSYANNLALKTQQS